MIYDLNNIGQSPFEHKHYDICICGAGVAGIVLALKLSKKYSVLLLEGGGLDFSVSSQEVFNARNVGQDYLDASAMRQRFFGGASNHWGGWCRPLDAHDFEKKSYVNMSGWPIQKQDLDKYVDETISMLDIEDAQAHPLDSFMKSIEKSQRYQAFNFWYSAPTRFGSKYRQNIEQAKNIDCFINANITDIVLNEDRVRHVAFKNYGKRVFNAQVGRLVLAAGGIENARILLSCHKQQKNGLGNQHDLVGRFFCEHPHSTVGGFILKGDPSAMAKNSFFSPSTALMEKEKILNFGLRVQNFDFPSDLRFADKVRNALCADEKNLDITDPNQHCLLDGLLRMASEQSPNYHSRIKLAQGNGKDDIDKFGMPRAEVHWQLSDIDIHTIKQGVLAFGQTMAELDLGRVQLAPWLRAQTPEFPSVKDDEVGGSHHMCTTRMAESAKQGVVDKHQKVFGLDNLFIAGSSVFSSTGHANPTFTLVQMTLRLADYLNTK